MIQPNINEEHLWESNVKANEPVVNSVEVIVISDCIITYNSLESGWSEPSWVDPESKHHLLCSAGFYPYKAEVQSYL